MPRWIKQVKIQGSASEPYTVSLGDDGTYGCSCPVWKFRREECKHISEVKALGGIDAMTTGKEKPDYVLANVLKPTFKEKENKLYIPLVPIGDTNWEATVCAFMLKHGYSIADLRRIRHIPKEWTAQAILDHVRIHGESCYPEEKARKSVSKPKTAGKKKGK